MELLYTPQEAGILIAADFCIIGSCMFFPQFGTYIERADRKSVV